MAQGAGRDHAPRVPSVRYPAATTRSANFAESHGAISTPNNAGASAAPSVLIPSARPMPAPDWRA
jgi:hypothetical protein